MAFKFPFTNYHELNLTWVLEQLKKLFEDSEENVETIEGYEDRLSAVEDELPVVEATADQAAQTANAAATLAQTAKNTADTANENALAASAQAGLARQEAAAAEAEAQAATQAAQQAQATVQNFDGRITQAENDASEALQEAQSFENRVNAAINTANNAANTATIAQGIAVNANQNAATALDTAQTADGKAEAAQDAADIADGKAEAAQDAAEVADGKAEAAQDTADQNAAKIGNLSDLTTTAKNNLVAAINEAAQTGSGTDDTKAPLIVSEASGAVASFSDGADDMQIQKLVCEIVPFQAGTGDPSPTNIRPISGHTGLNVTRTGVNIWDEQWELGQYRPNTGEKTDNSNNIRSKNYIPCKPNTTYCFVWGGWSAWAEQVLFYDADYNFLSNTNKSFASLPATFTTPATAYYMTFFVGGTSTYSNDISINYPSTDTIYHSGTSNETIPITWETEAGTVYGGTLDVVSGKLVVDRAFVSFDGNENWSLYTSIPNHFHVKEPNVLQNDQDTSNSISNQYTSRVYINSLTDSQGVFSADGNRIRIKDDRFSTVADFKAFLAAQYNANTPVEVVYKLTTPVEYTLTPAELTTLLGQNNIWTDVGAIQSCKYPTDTKLYIDGKVAELQALILEN